MKRKDFLQKGLTAGALLGSSAYLSRTSGETSDANRTDFEHQDSQVDDIFVERSAEGRPHEGKVLAAIQPHSDDIPLFAAGTVAKLNGLEWAERIHYVGPSASNRLDSYIEEHSVPL